MLGYHYEKVWISAARLILATVQPCRQLFVYTKNMSSRKYHTYKSKTLKCWCLNGAVPNCMHEAQHTGCIMHTWLHACKYTGQCNTLQLSCSFCLPKQNQSVHVHIPSLLRPRPKLLRFDALVSEIYGKALSHQHSFTAKLTSILISNWKSGITLYR